MLGDIPIADNIYIVIGYTDMRKSIDGLCAIILNQMKTEPDNRAIYLFCGKRCDRIKVILRKPDGYVLLYKRLDVVHGKYRRPRKSSEVKSITCQQFDWLMSGLEIEQPKACKARSKSMEKSSKDIQLSELKDLISQLNMTIKTWNETIAGHQTENDNLKAKMAWLKQKLFGSSRDMSDEELEKLAPWNESVKEFCGIK